MKFTRTSVADTLYSLGFFTASEAVQEETDTILRYRVPAEVMLDLRYFIENGANEYMRREMRREAAVSAIAGM